jgi:hypothetical protein
MFSAWHPCLSAFQLRMLFLYLLFLSIFFFLRLLSHLPLQAVFALSFTLSSSACHSSSMILLLFLAWHYCLSAFLHAFLFVSSLLSIFFFLCLLLYLPQQAGFGLSFILSSSGCHSSYSILLGFLGLPFTLFLSASVLLCMSFYLILSSFFSQCDILCTVFPMTYIFCHPSIKAFSFFYHFPPPLVLLPSLTKFGLFSFTFFSFFPFLY